MKDRIKSIDFFFFVSPVMIFLENSSEAYCKNLGITEENRLLSGFLGVTIKTLVYFFIIL